MIKLETAVKLKEAGLSWQPAQGDRFALLDRDMDDRIFVINDMATIVEMLQGMPAVTFHGTPEWALDYVHLGEAVWLPDEGQLRQQLHAILTANELPLYDLIFMDGMFTCRLDWQEKALAFRAEDASEAYAAALLKVMQAG